MPYAILQDLIDRFGEREIAQIAQGAALDVIDADRVERAYADVTAAHRLRHQPLSAV